MTDLIYKIEGAVIWAQAEKAGAYLGSALDLADGYIHLSTALQLRETASKWFARRAGLVVVHVDPAALGDTLKWEASRGGALFPHIYGPLPMSAVRAVVDMPVGDDGLHVFGPEIA